MQTKSRCCPFSPAAAHAGVSVVFASTAIASYAVLVSVDSDDKSSNFNPLYDGVHRAVQKSIELFWWISHYAKHDTGVTASVLWHSLSLMEAIIYDSLPNAADKMHREGLARKCLEHLDRVLSTRRRELPRRLKYGGFLIVDAEEELNPTQTDGSECGVYVITHMEHRGGPWPKGSIVTRLRIQILIKILSSPHNGQRNMVEALIRSEMEARAANARATRTSTISGRTIAVKAREIARRS